MKVDFNNLRKKAVISLITLINEYNYLRDICHEIKSMEDSLTELRNHVLIIGLVEDKENGVIDIIGDRTIPFVKTDDDDYILDIDTN